MKRILLILLLSLPTGLFSQRLIEVNGEYQSRVEYSVNDRDISTIFRKSNVFLDTHLPDRQTLAISQDEKIHKFSGIATYEKYRFEYEILCFDKSFKIIFTNFTYKSKPIEQHTNKLPEINQFLLDLCGKMQAFVRYS
jgi:hypothetical protein